MDGNQAYCSMDGVLFSKDGKTLVQYPPESERTEYRIPDSVTTIAECAFRSALNLKDIYVPKTVKTTGGYPFNLIKASIHVEGEIEQWDNKWYESTGAFLDFGAENLMFERISYVMDDITLDGFKVNDIKCAKIGNNRGYYLRLYYESEYSRIINFKKYIGDGSDYTYNVFTLDKNKE